MCGERRSVNVVTSFQEMLLLCQYGNSTCACCFDTITIQNEIAERRRNGLNVGLFFHENRPWFLVRFVVRITAVVVVLCLL